MDKKLSIGDMMITHSVYYYDKMEDKRLHKAAVFYGWFSEQHAESFAYKLARNLSPKTSMHKKPVAFRTQLGLVLKAEHSKFGALVKKGE